MVKIVVTAICYSSLLLICNNKAVTTAYIQQRHIDNVVRDNNNMIYDVDRPLVPPFPNGACGGTVVTIPKGDLYGQNNNNNFFDIKLLNPLSSFENVVLPPRDIKVWLPKQYHLPEYRYHHFPVLYW